MALVNKDALLYRGFFKEMAKLYGIPNCMYQHYKNNEVSFTHSAEIRGELADPIPIPLIYVDNPTQETLTTVGWVSETPEDKPYVVQIPFDTPYLRRGCKILIPYAGDKFDPENGSYRVFRITKINTIHTFPDSYICLLAPELTTDINRDDNDYKSSNFNYLEVNED